MMTITYVAVACAVVLQRSYNNDVHLTFHCDVTTDENVTPIGTPLRWSTHYVHTTVKPCEVFR